MIHPDNHSEEPAIPGNRIAARTLRWKLTRWTLAIAILMLGAAWWIDGEAKPKFLYLENFSWFVGFTLLVMGLWLLAFGKVHFFWLVDIDLKEERPAFRVGLALFHIRISEDWTKGCYRIRRTNMYLVVPTLVRLLLLGYVCYLFFGILDDRYVKIGSFLGTCGFGLAAWVTHRKWFPGTPDPVLIAETAENATPSKGSVDADANAASEATDGGSDISDVAD
jgi:hypothetical protein